MPQLALIDTSEPLPRRRRTVLDERRQHRDRHGRVVQAMAAARDRHRTLGVAQGLGVPLAQREADQRLGAREAHQEARAEPTR